MNVITNIDLLYLHKALIFWISVWNNNTAWNANIQEKILTI